MEMSDSDGRYLLPWTFGVRRCRSRVAEVVCGPVEVAVFGNEGDCAVVDFGKQESIRMVVFVCGYVVYKMYVLLEVFV